MGCSPPGSSVHGILPARILEWVAVSFSRGSSRPRDRTQVSRIVGRCFNLWATRGSDFSLVIVDSFVNMFIFTENFILYLTGFYANIKHNQGPVVLSFVFFNNYSLYLAELALPWCSQIFSCSKWGILFIAVHRLLFVLISCFWAQALHVQALVVVA